MSESIWFKDLSKFITEKNYDRFFPSQSMNYTEKLNSIMRLSVYFALIVLIIKRESNVLFIPILTAIITFLLYNGEAKQKQREDMFLLDNNIQKNKLTKELCQKPTENNPFMNILQSDYIQNPKRSKACSLSQTDVKKQANKYFNRNLYRDVSDVFHKNASDRNFYTTANTTIPNDQQAFLDFSYKIEPTCKEGSGRVCYANTYRNIFN